MRTMFITLALFTIACQGDVQPDAVADPIDECATCDSKSDTFGYDGYLGEAMLEVANTASLQVLDDEVRLYANAAANVVAARPFATLAEFDAVPYIGRASFERLATYVVEQGLVGYCGDGVEQAADQCGAADRCVQDCAHSADDDADVLSGTLAPYEHREFSLPAQQGDVYVIQLRNAGSEPWSRRVELLRHSQPLEYSEAHAFDDAHIPYRDEQLADGFEMWETADYTIAVANLGNTDGPFELKIECIGGGCLTDGPDQEPELPDVDVDPDSAFGGARDAALEQAMRDRNAGIATRDYGSARQFMFGELDNVDGVVTCVYTGTQQHTWGIPNHTVMNTEHLWPQSKSGPYTDLHHLRPTDTTANSRRSSFPFGEVTDATWSNGGSSLGYSPLGYFSFEPRDDFKGDTARAMFYIAVQYDLDIPEYEEATLREWHAADPPSAAERQRNDAVANFQNSRNYFIDHPELVERITDF